MICFRSLPEADKRRDWKSISSMRNATRFAPTAVDCEKTAKYEGKTLLARGRMAPILSQTFLRPAKRCEAVGVIIILGFSMAGNLFTSYSHPLGFLAASGLRLEMGRRSNKKISEVYFSSRLKKILTEKLNRRVIRTSNLTARARVDGPWQSRNFVAQTCRAYLAAVAKMHSHFIFVSPLFRS